MPGHTPQERRRKRLLQARGISPLGVFGSHKNKKTAKKSTRKKKK